MILAIQEPPASDKSWMLSSGEVMILILFVLVVIALVILVPQLLRASLRKAEMLHDERIKTIEHGGTPPAPDEPSKAAGRTAMLVPMVSVISAATVTCFLVTYRNENLFAVGMAVWAVVGVVSLAAVTGGVALLGRIAQLQVGMDDLETDKQAEKPTDPV